MKEKQQVITFITHSGSTYEVDDVKKRIRRLNGTKSPTQRQGADGSWRSYVEVSSIEVGRSVIILWDLTTPLLEGSPEDAIAATTTSAVKSVTFHQEQCN